MSKKQKKTDEKVTQEQSPDLTSVWCVESEDGRFIIDKTADGGLFFADYALMNPDDEEDMSFIFSFQPEDSDVILQMMKKAIINEEIRKINNSNG